LKALDEIRLYRRVMADAWEIQEANRLMRRPRRWAMAVAEEKAHENRKSRQDVRPEQLAARS